jgi:hypothetical protein
MVYLTPAHDKRVQRRGVLVADLVSPLHAETPKAVRGEVRIVLKVHFSNFSIHLSALEPNMERGNPQGG